MLAAAILGGAAISGLGSYFGGKQAAAAQNKSTRTQERMYKRTRADLSPYRELGSFGITELKDLLMNPSSITESPEYQFQLGEGLRSLSSRAAAGGTLQSGANLRDIVTYGQGLASSTLQSKIQNLRDLITIGGNAAAGGAQVGATYAGNIGQSIAGAGTARAAGTVGVSNAVGGGLSDYFLYNQLYGGGAGTSAGTGMGLGTTSGFNASTQPYGIFQ